MMEFTTPSMTCGHCVRVVSKALAHADPQAHVEIDLPNHQVLVETEKVRQTLVNALTKAAYPPPGDWAIHCHKSHHTMGPMGHDVPTMIGVDHRGVAEKILKLVPDYMSMGDKGMADMGEMQMPIPDNTLPMMTGQGPFGAIEMGGMFTTVKVREGLARDDYRDPGWYDHPKGTVSYEWTGETEEPVRKSEARSPGLEVQVRKPSGHDRH